MTLTIYWWVFPTLITVLGIIWALTLDDGGGYFSGLGNLLALIPVLAVSTVSWIVAAILK